MLAAHRSVVGLDRDADRLSAARHGTTTQPTVIVINHAKSVRVPVAEELTANDVRVQPDQLQVFRVVTLVQRGRAAFPIVHPGRRVAHDVNLKTRIACVNCLSNENEGSLFVATTIFLPFLSLSLEFFVLEIEPIRSFKRGREARSEFSTSNERGKRNSVSVISPDTSLDVAKHLIEHVREIKRDLRSSYTYIYVCVCEVGLELVNWLAALDAPGEKWWEDRKLWAG